MRRTPVLLLLSLAAILNVAAAPPRPRIDVNGDLLPAGAVARLGTLRFQPADPYSAYEQRGRMHEGIAAALSPDGATLAASPAGNSSVRIDFIDSATGKTSRNLALPAVYGLRMQYTPDGKSLALANYSGFQVIDARTGKVTHTIKYEQTGETAVTISADGKWLAAQPQKYVKHAPVRIWDLVAGKEVVPLPGRGASCKGLAFGPGGKRLLVWSIIPSQVSDSSISFNGECKAALACIDSSTRKVVAELTVSVGQAVALCPDGETVAIEDSDGVRVRHLPTAAERFLAVTSARFAFAPDGKVLFTIDGAGQAALWDAKKGKKIRDLDGTMGNRDFEVVGISRDGKTVAALDGGWTSSARFVVWNAATGKRAARPEGHDAAVTCLAFAPGGKLVASGSIDRTVRLWDARTGKHLRVLAVHKDAVRSVAFSADCKLVASSCRAGLTRVSGAADGKSVAEFTGPAKGAAALAFSPDGKVLFMGGDAPEVVGFEVGGTREVMRLGTNDDGSVMALARGGALALSANGEIRDETTAERLRVWDLTGKRRDVALTIRNADDQALGVYCPAGVFSPCARFVATSQVSSYRGIRPTYGNAKLLVWDRGSGKIVRTIGPVVTKLLAFSPNGRLLACGGAGNSGHRRFGYGTGIDVWDVLTGEKVGSLPVNPECIVFSPDGSRLATGGRDHCVVIWDAPKARPRQAVKAPSAGRRQEWWGLLGGETKGAFTALGEMDASPDHAEALLKKQVRPVKPCEPAAAKLIARLDSDDPDERDKAERTLEQMGEGVARLLVKALRGDASAEQRRRAQKLLKKWDDTSAEATQQHRAVLALEWIGSPAARALLREWAGGAEGARLTAEASAALERMGR